VGIGWANSEGMIFKLPEILRADGAKLDRPRRAFHARSVVADNAGRASGVLVSLV